MRAVRVCTRAREAARASCNYFMIGYRGPGLLPFRACSVDGRNRVAKGREKRPADISNRQEGRGTRGCPGGKRGGGDGDGGGGFARDGVSIPGVLHSGNTSSYKRDTQRVISAPRFTFSLRFIYERRTIVAVIDRR